MVVFKFVIARETNLERNSLNYNFTPRFTHHRRLSRKQYQSPNQHFINVCHLYRWVIIFIRFISGRAINNFREIAMQPDSHVESIKYFTNKMKIKASKQDVTILFSIIWFASRDLRKLMCTQSIKVSISGTTENGIANAILISDKTCKKTYRNVLLL